MSCPKHPDWPHAAAACPACGVQKNVALDYHGNVLPKTPLQVRQIVDQMVDEGKLICSIWRVKGDLAVRVEGPPSLETLAALEQATRGYRRALRSQAPKKKRS